VDAARVPAVAAPPLDPLRVLQAHHGVALAGRGAFGAGTVRVLM
jgi:hypothetical protein